MCYLLGVAVNRMFVRVRVFMESASLVEPQTGFRYIVCNRVYFQQYYFV